MNLSHFEYFFLGAAGAASLEILKLYEFHARLTQKKFQALVRSPLFWGVIVGMLAASGFIAWALNVDTQGVTVWHVVMTGMAARSIVREIGTSRAAMSSARVGASDEERITLKDIFR